MWGYIIGALVLVGTSVALILFKYFLRKEPSKEVQDKHKNIIKQPTMYLIGSIFATLIFVALMLLMILNQFDVITISNKEDFPLIYGLIFLILVGLLLIMVSANWKIEINENGFSYKNMWGYKRYYEFNDVKVEYKSASVRIYKNKKRIVNISLLQSNVKALTDVYSNYKKIHKTKKEQI